MHHQAGKKSASRHNPAVNHPPVIAVTFHARHKKQGGHRRTALLSYRI